VRNEVTLDNSLRQLLIATINENGLTLSQAVRGDSELTGNPCLPRETCTTTIGENLSVVTRLT